MDRYRILLVLLAALAPLMACTPDTPETLLTWNVNDSLARHSPAPKNAGGTARTYVYQGDAYAVPAPKPRPNPPAYAQTTGNDNLAAANVGFTWPLKGRIISQFGTAAGGARNDGINIATAAGTPIRAAASGTVSYAGDELKDYGNLVLIRHADNYVTAYAHADHLIVAKGDNVTKGQVIGYAGSTGDVSSPQLHFEIRHGTTPLDPSSLLEARNS